MSDKELSYKLSLYIDGALSEEETRELEQYIARHPDAERELRELRAMKQILGEKEKIRPNIGFWTRLNATLDDMKEEEHNLLPFPRKYVPAITTLGIVSMVAVGVILFQQRDGIVSFLSEKSEQVQQAYESNFLRGAISPLLSNLDEDNVLQFALFGTLPLDEDSETALRVDETTEKGYTIEVGKAAKANEDGDQTGKPVRRTPALTVRDFYSEIKPTPQQALMIDSVLRLTQKQLVASVFMAEDEALAIDPGLPKLGRVTVSSIAACLEPAQRVRFEKLLNTHNAPYKVVQTVTQSDAKRRLEQAMATLHENKRPERFMIVTPDTLILRQLEIDVEHLQGEMPQVARRTRADFERFTRQLTRSKNQQRVVVSGTQPMRVRTDENGFFSIEYSTDDAPEPTKDDIIQIVKPRYDRPNFYFFQKQLPGGATMQFHVIDSIPYSTERLDSMRMLIRLGKVKSYGPKLDSLMNHIEQQRVKNDLREENE